MNQQSLYEKLKLPKLINPLNLINKTGQVASKVKTETYGISNNLFNESPFQKTKRIQKNQKMLKKEANKQHTYKTKLCPQGRQCKRQFTCKFAHHEKQLRKPFIRRTKACIEYQRGQCTLGSACRDYHGNIDLKKNYKYKAQLCQSFLKGICQKGKLCIYKHGDDDIGLNESKNISKKKDIIEEKTQKQFQINQICQPMNNQHHLQQQILKNINKIKKESSKKLISKTQVIETNIDPKLKEEGLFFILQ